MTAIAVILMKLAVMGIVVTLTDAKHVWTTSANQDVTLTIVKKHVWTARAKYAAATRTVNV